MVQNFALLGLYLASWKCVAESKLRVKCNNREQQELQVHFQISVCILQPTELRLSPTYYHWYHVVVNSAVMIVAPSVIMVYCSHSVYRQVNRIEGTWQYMPGTFDTLHLILPSYVQGDQSGLGPGLS